VTAAQKTRAIGFVLHGANGLAIRYDNVHSPDFFIAWRASASRC
jgi:hypothetical protein